MQSQQVDQYRYWIDGGDGDQDYFSEKLCLKQVSEPWFKGKIARGEALLFLVESGDHRGAYVALSSRVLASIADQFSFRDWASVVVHIVRNPTDTFDGGLEQAQAIGMSVVFRAPRRQT